MNSPKRNLPDWKKASHVREKVKKQRTEEVLGLKPLPISREPSNQPQYNPNDESLVSSPSSKRVGKSLSEFEEIVNSLTPKHLWKLNPPRMVLRATDLRWVMGWFFGEKFRDGCHRNEFSGGVDDYFHGSEPLPFLDGSQANTFHSFIKKCFCHYCRIFAVWDREAVYHRDPTAGSENL